MGRLVRKPVVPDLDLQIAGLEGVLQSDIAGMQLAAAVPGDNYVERMIKYIPGEVIGFSMLINAILDQAMKAGGPGAAMAGLPITAIATGALLIGCILTPLFCWYVREDGDAWIVNAAVSTIAFPFWAYLMGAVAFAGHPRRQPRGDPGADLHRDLRPDLAGGEPAEACRPPGGRAAQGRAAAGRGVRLGPLNGSHPGRLRASGASWHVSRHGGAGKNPVVQFRARRPHRVS